jgi:hypothetical protein
MIRPALLTSLLAAAVGAAPPKNDGPVPPPKQDPPPLVRLAAQAAKAPRSALAYRLLPDPLDQVDGNAAALWIRAGTAAREVRHKWTEAQWNWAGPQRTPLDKLPQKEVATVLAKHDTALRLIDLAVLRKHCDWGHLPVTVQNLPLLPLAEIQSMREIAHLINLRCRLALAEKKFDEAHKSIVAGLTLARHIGQGQTVIQDLVGVAIAAISLSRIEEWMQIPGSPNLYWSLTTLPRPFIDVRRNMRHEMDTIYRSFPQLRRFKEKKLTADEAKALLGEFFATLGKVCDEVPGLPNKADSAAAALSYYPAARKALIASGRPAKEVEAMPKLQVVGLWLVEDYDRIRDDIDRWLAVPPWQGMESLARVEKEYRQKAKKEGTINSALISLLMPALVKVYHAHLRLDRQLAGLRGAEALRHYAAGHAGRTPAKWADITDLPGPIDPFTGKGLDAFYKVERDRTILEIPPPPGMPALLGRRYELAHKVS